MRFAASFETPSRLALPLATALNPGWAFLSAIYFFFRAPACARSERRSAGEPSFSPRRLSIAMSRFDPSTRFMAGVIFLSIYLLLLTTPSPIAVGVARFLIQSNISGGRPRPRALMLPNCAAVHGLKPGVLA